MQNSLGPSTLIWLVLVPLIAYRIYRRIRRSIGRQRLGRVRPWITVTLFPILLLLIGLSAWRFPASLAALAAGAALGLGLGILGLRLTRFERSDAGFFYVPNVHLGVALSVLLLARLAYRFVPLLGGSGAPPLSDSHSFVHSPLTLVLFGTLAGYYTTYAVGLLRWRFSADGPVPGPPAASAAIADGTAE